MKAILSKPFFRIYGKKALINLFVLVSLKSCSVSCSRVQVTDLITAAANAGAK